MDLKRTFDEPGTEAVPAFPSSAEIDAHLARARQLRAEATAPMLTAAGRGVARSLGSMLAAFARWQERRRTCDALMRCSDRVLADIGIEREHIVLIARGIDPQEHESSIEALRRRWASARARLEVRQAVRRERRRIYRELMAYDDGELDDLGVRRPDIAAIATGGPHLRSAA